MSNLINLEKFNIYEESPRDILKKEFDRISQITDLIEFEIKNVHKYLEAEFVEYYDQISVKSKYFDYEKDLFRIKWFNNTFYYVSIYIDNDSPLFKNDFLEYIEKSFYVTDEDDYYKVEELNEIKFKDFLKRYLFNSKFFINEINKALDIAREYKLCSLFNKTKSLDHQNVLYKEGSKEITYIAILDDKIVQEIAENEYNIKNIFSISPCDQIEDDDLDEIKYNTQYHFIQECVKKDEKMYIEVYPVKPIIKEIKEYNKL